MAVRSVEGEIPVASFVNHVPQCSNRRSPSKPEMVFGQVRQNPRGDRPTVAFGNDRKPEELTTLTYQEPIRSCLAEQITILADVVEPTTDGWDQPAV